MTDWVAWWQRADELLEQEGVTQTELARRVDRSYRTVARWHSEAIPPPRSVRPSIAAISPGLAELIAELPADPTRGALGPDELRRLIRETVVDVLETEQFPRLAELQDAADRIEKAVALLLEPPASRPGS